MTTRTSKTPARVATVTVKRVGKHDRVYVSGGDGGRAPISLPANADKGHAERLAAALRGFLADAFLAGRDSLKAEIDMMNEPLKGME